MYNFYETLASHVRTLDTLAKLKEFVRAAVDKLPGIRPDLVRLDDDWQQWGFDKLVDDLRKWCDRNPVQASDRRANSRSHGHGHSYQASSTKFGLVFTLIALSTNEMSVRRAQISRV